jgi:nitrous oxide reductase accessory protein NosL
MDRVRRKKEKVKRKKEKGKTGRRAVAATFCLFTFAFLLLTSSCGPGDRSVPAGALMGSCPVCRMKVRASDDWAAEIYFKDGTKVMFESPVHMLAFNLAPEEFQTNAAHNDPANVDRIMVKDYQSKQPFDARQATLVFESKVEGPMGRDVVPFSKREDAESFIASHGGRLMVFGGVVKQMLGDLRK